MYFCFLSIYCFNSSKCVCLFPGIARFPTELWVLQFFFACATELERELLHKDTDFVEVFGAV